MNAKQIAKETVHMTSKPRIPITKSIKFKACRLRRRILLTCMRFRYNPAVLNEEQLQHYLNQLLSLQKTNDQVDDQHSNTQCFPPNQTSKIGIYPTTEQYTPSHLQQSSQLQQDEATQHAGESSSRRKRQQQCSSTSIVPNPQPNATDHSGPWNFGPPTFTCEYCNAMLWYEERSLKSKKVKDPKFSLCCMKGRVQLPFLKHPPPLLSYLLGPESGKAGQNFRNNIRLYNSMFAFASMGAKVDHAINQRRGPYCYRVNGQNFHMLGSLLPQPQKEPSFAQLYIYDTENEVSNRMKTMKQTDTAKKIDPQIVSALLQMLDDHNVLVKSFRMVRDRVISTPDCEYRLRLISNRSTDGRQYNTPTASEVAGLIVGDFSAQNFNRDVIVEHRSKGLQRITDLHPSFMSMTYPLLHPYGEDGYRTGILLREMPGTTDNTKTLTMRQHHCFRLQQRADEAPTILRGGRLLQQYIVDCYMAIEEERFRWIRNNQKKLRTELYSGLMDAAYRGDSDSNLIGKSIILPSSHTGGPRYRVQNYQDAMAICRWAGYPDLFITFTCNPKWPEINYMLNKIEQNDDENRVDIICRVFEIKLHELMTDLKQREVFGKTKAVLYTIEFQKRGLPHAHILLFLHPSGKNPSPEHIDSIINAEIPDEHIDFNGNNAVKKFMLHGPCGINNADSPCMSQGKCSKHFPKKFNDNTTVDADGFPLYRRRHTGITIEKKGVLLDNRYVVPYNRDLIVKFDAHINVELCNRSRSIKYLFKYVHKGSDKAIATVEHAEKNSHDEIKSYLDCRYISATEACWRIFQFDIHHREPSVERLPFHLQGEHTVTFEEDEALTDIVNRPGIETTKFTEWFQANKKYPAANQWTYTEFPMHWVWKDKKWKERQTGFSIGRIYFAHPSSGERYYLRMLLNIVKGSTSFENIRTINGVLHPTFKSACYALGLLDDDKEWNDCLQEASIWASGIQLRQLFVTILMHCQVSDANQLWNSNYSILSEDITHLQKARLKSHHLILSEEQKRNYTLLEIENILLKMGKSLAEIDGMPFPDPSLLKGASNRLLQEELSYNCGELLQQHMEMHASLNDSQRIAYEAIIDSANNKKGRLFFINGPGGTGKTFLWKVVTSKLRSEGCIVLPVATSGIAALLLPNGRTAHSRFHIPLDITAESTCEIRHGTQLAQLLCKTSLIIWDEAPMANKWCFEALDKSLRDILRTTYVDSSEKPFGGMTVVCGGDFRQILPVVPKGRRADIVEASLNSSYLWPYFNVFHLTENMRLKKMTEDRTESEKVAAFDRWLLQIGNGSAYDDEADQLIKIPEENSLTCVTDPMEEIVTAIYPMLDESYNDPDYLKERAILTPKNDTVHELNEFIIDKLPGEPISYFSSDSICNSNCSGNEEDMLYTTEFLNSLQFPGIPNHIIRLKVGLPVMLLRNINQTEGLCNGTRLIVTKLEKWSVTASIISGMNKGCTVTIPRIIMSPNESKWPFKLKRRQFPLVPCFSMTINKSQGQSLSSVGLFLPKQVFTHGQLYVAASRVTEQKGLIILNSDDEMKDTTFIKNIVYEEIFQNICYSPQH